MKIRPVGAELFHVDGRTAGQTDMTKLIVAFGSFANAPKNPHIFHLRGSLRYKVAQAICYVPCRNCTKSLSCLAHLVGCFQVDCVRLPEGPRLHLCDVIARLAACSERKWCRWYSDVEIALPVFAVCVPCNCTHICRVFLLFFAASSYRLCKLSVVSPPLLGLYAQTTRKTTTTTTTK
jgi:hypothetical protein